MTMSPRDRVLNNELVTNKVNKVKFNSIYDYLKMVFILKTGDPKRSQFTFLFSI